MDTIKTIIEGTTTTDWLMVFITIVYAVTTFFISQSNKKSADAAKKSADAANAALEESKEQSEQNIELQIKHNRDSVKPMLSVDFSSGYIDQYFIGEIKITNHGLGPAIIKALIFKKNEKEIVNKNKYCTFLDLVCKRAEKEQLDLPIDEIFKCYTKEFRNEPHDRDILAVNERLTLLFFKARNQEEARKVGKIFNGVTMELVYTNIYDEEQEHIIKRLRYFQPDWVGSQDTYDFLMGQ